jgi:hypothetical protein
MHPALFMVESLAEQRALLAEVERARLAALLPPQPSRELGLSATISRLGSALGKLRLGDPPIDNSHRTEHRPR